MGVNYKAIAILGVKIDYNAIPMLKKTGKKPEFDHNYSEDCVFDPKTGKKLWTNETQEVNSDVRKYVFGYDDYSIDGIYEQYFTKDGTVKLKCLYEFKDKIITCYKNNDNEYWVGIVADNTYSNGGKVEDFRDVLFDLKYILKKLLESYELWNEKNYGLYSVLNCSY